MGRRTNGEIEVQKEHIHMTTPLSEHLSAILSRCPEEFRTRMKRVLENPPTPEEVAGEEERRKQECIQAYRRSCLQRSGLSGKQLANSFKTFTFTGTKEEIELQKTAVAAAHKFAVSFPEVERGVAFWGKDARGYGVGKDHLLHAIANFVLTNKPRIYDVRYRFSHSIVHNMREEWQKHNDSDTREGEVLRECDLLLIGDLHDFLTMGELGFKGKEIQSEVFDLLNQCESVGRPRLCFTSNLSPTDFDNDALRLGSRLAACVECYEVRGPDRRRE